jgi:hypothetical protein
MSISSLGKTVSTQVKMQQYPDQNQSQSIEEQHERGVSEPVVTDGGYDWVCVLAILLINVHTWGISTVSLDTKTMEVS